MIRFTRLVLVASALAIVATPVLAQTAPPIKSDQVEILGASQRATSGARIESANDRDSRRVDNRGGRGGSENSGPGSVNSGSGSGNSGPGSANSGHGSANSGSGHSGENSGRGGLDDNRISQSGDARHEDRRSNSGRELRGLDRADHVAGDHGQQGRDDARMVQMDQFHRSDRGDLHQRPDQLERQDREGRQGRH